jgi:cyclic beta-1,2-glucan synthetase
VQDSILIGYFAKRDSARRALKKLHRMGFHRAALVSKAADGRIQTRDPFLRHRIVGATAAFILCGVVAEAVAKILQWPIPIPAGNLVALLPGLSGGFIGILLSLAWIRRSRFGVERQLLADHGRWLVFEETVLILRAPIKTLNAPVAMLQESDEIPPAIFFLNPRRKHLDREAESRESPLAGVQIQEYAERLARDHQLGPNPRRNIKLLKRLAQTWQWIHRVCLDLSEATLLEQTTPSTADWLLDNEYIVESNVREVQLNLPRRYYQQLPTLTNGPYRGLPRIYGLAAELVSHAGSRLDKENILAFIKAYQSVNALSIGELWAFPQMLRMALIEGILHLAERALTELREREIADFWANRLIAASRRDPTQPFSILAILAELAESQPNPSPYLSLQLIDNLYDYESALVPVRSWLEGIFRKSMGELNLRERNRQTKDLISMGNAFTSLRHLSLLDWRELFEELNHVELLLRQDPSGVYPTMDFDTRDRYRQAIEELARSSGQTEEGVAQRAIELATQAAQATTRDDRLIHVGTYLIGSGRQELARLIQCREALRFRTLQWIYRHHFAVYVLGLSFFSSVFISLTLMFGLRGATPGIILLFVLLLSIPASQLAFGAVNYLITRLLPPRALPKMDFEKSGIPDEFRTLVVVPMLLLDAETIRAEVEKLEIRFLANKENNLLFGLFSDYKDYQHEHAEEDTDLLKTAIEGIEALNRRYGGERFFLFHRERRWCETERKFIGWERKRGKLEELNRLLAGTRPEDAGQLVYVGSPDHLSNVRFVITLDTDTQLPVGTGRRLIETLSHPLNRPRFDAAGKIIAGSYTIIQPRIIPSLPSASASPFTRLFSDAVGIDPYTKAIPDVNQDLAGEGSYLGKGIYDVRAFSHVLSGGFPEQRLLSHDLIEGAHVRVGLASDIELYDEFPQDYLCYVARQHRWIRGDWQVADWILPRVPLPGGRRGPNLISGFDRWKVFDNLRRSLIPTVSLSLLIASWFTSHQIAWIASLLVAMPLLFHPLMQPITWATTKRGLKSFSLAKVSHDLLRAIVEAALLPHQAWLALDAIVRFWYRRLISHRRLLEWTSTQQMQSDAPKQRRRFVTLLGLVSIFSVLAGVAVRSSMPANLLAVGPWLVLWFLSPLIGWVLTLRPQAKHQLPLLSKKDLQFLREVARRTWRYFSDFVGDDTSWLPPDNYQVSHKNQLAMRTSPTNIGFWLLSAIAAHDFGYVTVDQVINKLTHTMETIGRLERYKGHLLNWYDIETLNPLEPRYVSMVDSGNLLASLWAVEHGLDEMMDGPILDAKAFAGLRDTGEILQRIAAEEGVTALDSRGLDELIHICEEPPVRIADALHQLRRLEKSVKVLYHRRRKVTEGKFGADYWAKQLQYEVSAWLSIADRYLAWIEIIGEKTEAEIASLYPDAARAFREDLQHAPSLRALANGDIGCIKALQAIRRGSPSAEGPLLAWTDRLLQAFTKVQATAAETLALGNRLILSGRELSESIDMRFLYDPERRLFAIGYNVSEGRVDSSYYDLLASEARLGSFVAIARGDAPVEHWFSMSRPYRSINRRRVLLSWTGSMFEYLMPLIFQHSYGNSLLDRATSDAVTIHIAYGRRHRMPWGMSESAFGDLDINKTYQYKAFGVPSLGLKRDLGEEVVVAPYATLLAVNKEPKAGIQNLRRLATLQLFNDYGYYEAIDFSRQPSREGERGVIVRAYMTHHQAMGFLSLTNFLHGNIIQRRFRADTRVRAVEPLLHERIPVLPPLHHISMREGVPSLIDIGEVAPSISKFDTPHTSIPKTQLLSNGRYCLMLTNAGGGYSQWNTLEITRWRADRSQDPWGTFCYIREADADRLWSTTYHPTGGKIEKYSASFALDRALFRRTDNDIQTETEVIVSPEDDVEIRRITLVNRSLHSRRLELTSYVELSMAPHNADRQHPVFNKMFIETEAVPAHQALLAYRRPRGESDPSIYVAHRFMIEQAEEEALQFETDRMRFIGRGRMLANPLGIFRKLDNSEGFVLDPILSLRRSVVLSPGQRIHGSLIVAAGETREQVLKLTDKYSDPYAIERAMGFSQASARLELRLLHIQPDDARRFQQLASHLLFPNPLLRASAECIEENCKGQAGLWPYGISGDLPIVLITIGEAQDVTLVRQMLQAHAYWQNHGLKVDLVILNEEASGYEQPLRERLDRLVRTHAMHAEIDKPGGVYVRNANLMPEEDVTLLMTAASAVLVAARGTVPQQLSMPAEAPELPKPLVKKPAPREPSPALPFLELIYFNGLGGFTQDGREYVMYLGPETQTPTPWVNIIANPTFGTVVSETGAGFTWYGNSQRNRLSHWSNDPVIDPPSEALYIRDEDTGVYWTPTPAPIREKTPYRIRHGAGYTVFEHNSNGIEQELLVLVPIDENGGVPIKLQRLRLRNDSARHRTLSVTYYVEWILGEHRELTQMHVVTDWDDEARVLLARNRYHAEYGDRVAFAAINPPAESFNGDRTAFLGRNRSMENPVAMERASLSRRTGTGLDPCAALQDRVELPPGERAEITCMLGQAGSVEEVHKLVKVYLKGLSCETIWGLTKTWWDNLLGTIEVHTPDRTADLLINRWLLYQSLNCRLWGRAAVYQPGGAFGFRDQLQDVMALSYAYPEQARGHILLAANRQFKEGDVQHWWHPPNGTGLRSRISDDPLWLPYVAAHYIRVTGDVEILHTEVPFLNAPLLQDDQREDFSTPEIAREHGTLFEHCTRAVSRGLTLGTDGLPLIGTGDWNDGMNLVGIGGRGESVWLAWFLVDVLQEMAGLADLLNQPNLSKTYQQERKTLMQRIEQAGWDGEWYLRAIFDDGTPLGSAQNEEAQIDSLPQSWAWLSGGANTVRAGKALEAAWSRLVREDEGLVLLLEPPFDKAEPSPGYIKGYPPGVRENGGQYTHAALWLAMAMARRGDGDRAVKIMRMLNPIEKTRDPEGLRRYGIEPYVLAADVSRLPGRIGQGGWSWYTGSAAWMYRAWVEEILGLQVRGDHLQMNPVIPRSWEGFTLRYRHGEAIYEITVENPEGSERGIAWIELDGQRMREGAIPLERTLVKHRVLVHMGTPEHAV